ncbi:hypothetical protein TBLA_0G01650 [Henningerozyma blattae CBS 6284]|uniref:SPX domain-containing protein n=1 Tax=Henningerozyma blattae (strain ATCC 34711 / CBS 6284 / DSM 70876 / NBRC 10599 / NRRL Y-10934 / UCD 77-7) TaxID=1071380 RepID=I2H6V7_HENB6|nr:hypothetical protein TBLA_0G01650 [Tetrapisispora blattae CBS 6284]CCH62109.1 hypothetical protein TBLA_0G01650 [Tetrapisispora blattae CBS 6284]
MKFSHSLQFNAVPEWSSKYIAYSNLKKLIYQLQRDKLYNRLPHDLPVENSSRSTISLLPVANPISERPPILPSHDPYTKLFINKLDLQLAKIDRFYKNQYKSLVDNIVDLKDDLNDYYDSINTINRTSPQHNNLTPQNSLYSVDSNVSLENPNNNSTNIFSMISNNIHSLTSNRSNSAIPVDLKQKLIFKKRLLELFTLLNELKDFIVLNKTGFTKICKKFDKSLESTPIKKTYLQRIETHSVVFNNNSIVHLQNYIQELITLYANLFDHMNQQDAREELSSHLKEHIIWERNTVWKDMINLERKFQSTSVTQPDSISHSPQPYDSSTQTPLLSSTSGTTTNHYHSTNNNSLSKPKHKNKWRYNKRLVLFTAITSVFIFILSNSPATYNLEDLPERNCLALLIYSSLLWATEVIPLFVTSLFIPLLIVMFPMLKDPNDNHKVLSSIDASNFILSSMWSNVIMLLLGGFTLAAALSKYNIAKIISTHILSSVGTNPKLILLTNMFIAFFISIFISNVAAPVITYSIIQPILRILPKRSTYAQALILGIAFASNIGGMSSPISSPQNIFALTLMDPSPNWIDWFVVSIPTCLISIILIWIFLLLTFDFNSNSQIQQDSAPSSSTSTTSTKPLKLLKIHPINDPLNNKQKIVIFISSITILLWCFADKLSFLMGDMGIISIIPIVTLFGTGLLTSDDFNNFMWTIVILAMGGATLGKAVSMSGLLATIAVHIKESIQDKPIFLIVLLFGIMILTMATFISHTVAAMIIIPLMKEIGNHLPSDHSRLLIMISTLLCSSAMGLPTSGFPNVTAISMTDEIGNRYLSVKTFITRGVPSSLLAYLVIVTIGFGLLELIGF